MYGAILNGRCLWPSRSLFRRQIGKFTLRSIFVLLDHVRARGKRLLILGVLSGMGPKNYLFKFKVESPRLQRVPKILGCCASILCVGFPS